VAHKTLAEALFAAQKEMPDLVKDSTNPHFKSTYISLHGLLDQVVPILQKHDILFVQLPSTADGGEPALTTSFIFIPSGDSLSATTPLVLAQQSAQGQGGAITYMRRYALMAALALVAEDEDDDGNGSSRGATSGSRAKSSGTARAHEENGGLGADDAIGI